MSDMCRTKYNMLLIYKCFFVVHSSYILITKLKVFLCILYLLNNYEIILSTGAPKCTIIKKDNCYKQLPFTTIIFIIFNA